MFVGTSPAFDLAMFSTCFIRGNVAAAAWVNGCRVTDCDCQINVGAVASTVVVRAVERQANPGKVVTVYPRSVVCKICFSTITSYLLRTFSKNTNNFYILMILATGIHQLKP